MSTITNNLMAQELNGPRMDHTVRNVQDKWLKRYGTERQILNMFDYTIDINGNVNYPRLNDIYR